MGRSIPSATLRTRLRPTERNLVARRVEPLEEDYLRATGNDELVNFYFGQDEAMESVAMERAVKMVAFE